MVDQIYYFDSHEPCVFILELLDVSIFSGFNFLVLEGLFHGCDFSDIFDMLSCMYHWPVDVESPCYL